MNNVKIHLAAIFFCLFCALPARAENDAGFLLHSLSVVPHGGDARMEASISVSNTAMLQASLREGAALNLETVIMLERLRSVLPNKTVDEKNFRCQLRFDPLTRDYVLFRADSPPLRRKKLELLLDAILGDAGYTLTLPTDRDPEDRYRASLTLSLRYADVPPWLKKTLFFWSWDVIGPTTFTLDFSAPLSSLSSPASPPSPERPADSPADSPANSSADSPASLSESDRPASPHSAPPVHSIMPLATRAESGHA